MIKTHRLSSFPNIKICGAVEKALRPFKRIPVVRPKKKIMAVATCSMLLYLASVRKTRMNI